MPAEGPTTALLRLFGLADTGHGRAAVVNIRTVAGKPGTLGGFEKGTAVPVGDPGPQIGAAANGQRIQPSCLRRYGSAQKPGEALWRLKF